MTWAEFKKKWARYRGKESSAYQEHFNDLCRLLGHSTPAEADPSGTEFFCFQKRVVKDLELFDLPENPDVGDPRERGFADVWKKDCFGWEYKGKKKNLDEAYKQLQRYREALLNPPLLVVCDFDRYIVKTNFNGTVQETHEIINEHIDRPENLRLLRSIFNDPGYLKPQRTTAQVTETVAQKIAAVARSLQTRESVELADAKTRKEVNVGQKKNLRIARFLNRLVFCMFAEDTGLLPKNLFTDILNSSLLDAAHFSEAVENLFRVMAQGGLYGKDKIRHFNGHLFDDSSVFELTEAEIKDLAEAAAADWQFIEPSIMGTLFERALDENQRSQLGAHYTSETDIKTLVEPVLMQPYRREWATIKGELAAAYAREVGKPADRTRLAEFQKQLATVTVLDPACGSGNFLYVALQLLLGLEKEVITFGTQLGFSLKPQVAVTQLKAIEINPYAFELAQVSVQIGYLQWRRDNGFDNDRTPVLQNLDGFQNEDALLVPHFRNKAKTLKEAQAGEHKGDDALKFYTEREWPVADVIIGNPPFLHSSKLIREIGENYRACLFDVFKNRLPGFCDLCCYWFEKARSQIAAGNSKRAGLLATQSIRGGASREVLKRINETGGIFFAKSDREWVLSGASVHVSMVGFDNGNEIIRELDGRKVSAINPNLTADANITQAVRFNGRDEYWAYGSQQKAPFDIQENLALEYLLQPNPSFKPNSNVVRPSFNATQFLRRTKVTWVVDFALEKNPAVASQYEKPFEFCRTEILPLRKDHREPIQRNSWWMHARPSPAYRAFAESSKVLLVTPAVSKHRIFALVDSVAVPDHALITFKRSDMVFFGLLQSRLHELWSRAQATQVRERESGLRYTPKVCFETFPFPFSDDLTAPLDNLEAELDAAKHYHHITLRENSPPGTPAEHRAAIAAAARELNELRERWLNPPEWTEEKILEFPASLEGPWARYVDPKSHDAKTGLYRARYPRLEPKDAECAAKLKKRTLTNLYNERPAWLDFAHKKLDAAVAAAYGWPADLSDEAILEKLLALNLERAAAEVKAAKTKQRINQREKLADELV